MTQKTPSNNSLVGVTMGTALFGAIVGGTAAAAKGIRQVKDGSATKEEVAVNVAREAGTTAVAAGAAAAVVGALGFGPILSTLGIAAVATGTKYAMDSLVAPKTPATATAGKKHAPLTPAPKKTAAQKTAPKKAAAKKTTAKKTAAKKTTTKKAAPKKTAKPKATSKKTTTPKAKPETPNTDKK